MWERGAWFGGRHRNRGPRGGFWGRFSERGFPGWPDDRPPRAERGSVRYLVLDAIADNPRHGYEIMQVIEERSRGAYRPSPGVIYPTLQMLDELGHVKVTERDDKKLYAITPAGTRELEEHRDDVKAFYEQSDDAWDDRGDDVREVMVHVRQIMRAFRRAARRGLLTPTRMARVTAILANAAAKLEAVLDE
jgi:DNA-binding PadR family transcriptional regulator